MACGEKSNCKAHHHASVDPIFPKPCFRIGLDPNSPTKRHFEKRPQSPLAISMAWQLFPNKEAPSQRRFVPRRATGCAPPARGWHPKDIQLVARPATTDTDIPNDGNATNTIAASLGAQSAA
jgi:hypothetical protein